MELREFAELVLFSTSLEEKLRCPDLITDERPGRAIEAPKIPGRPRELQFKTGRSESGEFPGRERLDNEHERGRLLHFFANHELLATELMALVLLRFPDAPAAFRRGVLQTLKDEQMHTKLYLQRMKSCGVQFGDLPVSGYFWRSVSGMENPVDYVAGLCLTFEQANLDFCRQFAGEFRKVGDDATGRLLDKVYRDEIGHVAYGLKWFRRWKNPGEGDWEAFCRQLKFPLSPQRAKGPSFNVQGRRDAGIDPEFVAELDVYSQSKGRTPAVFVFNPFAELFIAGGKTFTPGRLQREMAHDLSGLAQFLCRQDDVVLVPRRPSTVFLAGIKQAGFALPEFVEIPGGSIDPSGTLARRKLGRLRPWAWSPDSVELLNCLFRNLPDDQPRHEDVFNPGIAQLFSKTWSTDFLRGFLAGRGGEPWLCPAKVVGTVVDSFSRALNVIEEFRARGFHRLVVKEALGLAGGNALRLWEDGLSDRQRRWLERAVAGGRQLVIEPWLERVCDFSMQCEMETRGLRLCGFTGLENDTRGQFIANRAAPNFAKRIPADVAAAFDKPADVVRRLHRVFDDIRESLGGELSRFGYFGPVGVDAFAYRDEEGMVRLKPVVEINPRFTMGRVTVELMKHVTPGSTGVFRVLNRARTEEAGFDNFHAYATAISREHPLRLAGEPVRKIKEGFLCLNDPESARVSLATFMVSRDAQTGSRSRKRGE